MTAADASHCCRREMLRGMGQAAPDGSPLAGKALDWLLEMAHERGTDLAWTGRPDDDELDPTLYSGTAGIVLALLEGYQHFGEDRYAQAAVRGARTLAAAVAQVWPLSSLYSAWPAWRSRCARSATCWEIARRPRPRSARWTSSARGSTGSGGPTSSSCSAATPASRWAPRAPATWTWPSSRSRRTWPPPNRRRRRALGGPRRSPGPVPPPVARHARHRLRPAADRPRCRPADLIDLALAGAADVVARNEAGPDGFLVPHSDPQHSRN